MKSIVLLALLLVIVSCSALQLATQIRSVNGWRNERIISAQKVARPTLNVRPYNHHGIMVTLASGRKMLFHDDRDKGVVATDAINMSNKWFVEHNIPVNHVIKAQNLMNVMSSSANPRVAGPTDYLASGTCYYAAQRGMVLLEKGMDVKFPVAKTWGAATKEFQSSLNALVGLKRKKTAAF